MNQIRNTAKAVWQFLSYLFWPQKTERKRYDTEQLLDQAVVNPRLRQSYDLRTEAAEAGLGHKDNSQRILNAVLCFV